MNDFSAFPIPLDDRPGAYPAEPGMSFRDAAALHALPSIMPLCVTDTRADGESQEDLFARKSYAVADAMLKARVRAVQATVSMDLHNRIVQRLEWLIHDQPINVQEFAADVRELLRTAGVPEGPQPATQVPSNNYVQPVPDHCDRIVWRNHYYHLPLPAGVPGTEGGQHE